MDEKRNAIQSEIAGCKQLLCQTDYKAIKYAEGLISDGEYKEIKAERQKLRDNINNLEKKLAAIEESEAIADAE